MKSLEIIKKLESIPKEKSDLVGPLYEALDEVKKIDDPKNFFPFAFEFMRERSSADFGVPGPLSHLIEEYFPDYVGDLAESLKIKPTEPTLFLARRIFNSARLTKDKDSIQALPTLVKAMQFAKEHLELEPCDIEEIDQMLSECVRRQQMLCERCQLREAMIHITEEFGPSRDEITATTKRHLCEACAEDYQGESQRYLEQQSSRLVAGMSKAERAAAMQKLRDEVRQHMTDWISRR